MPKKIHARLLKYWLDLQKENKYIKEAERIANELQSPETATPDQCWGLIWDKPLYVNTLMKIGYNNSEKLSPYVSNAWREWGLNEETVKITHLGGSNARSNFVVSG